MASVVINGDTSGSITLSAPAVAGATSITLPSVSTVLNFINSNGATSGYAILPNGLIIQWAYQTGFGNYAARPFPIAFPTAVVSVVATIPGTSQHWEAYTIYGWTASTWTGYTRYGGDPSMIIAIGY